MNNNNERRETKLRRRDVLKTAGVVGGGIALAGCSGGGDGGGGTTSPSGGTQTLQVGQAIPLTGAGNVYGLPTEAGTRLAVEDINDDGGIEAGGTTYELEYVTEDSQCAPEAGRSAAQRLISDTGVDLMFGGNCPTANLAWVNLVTDTETFLIINGNESVELHGMGNEIDYIFSPFTVIYNQAFPNLSRMYPFGTYAIEELGFESVAFLTPEIQYGLSTQQYIAQAVRESGGNVSEMITHSFGASDFSNQIARLQSLDVDAVISSTFPNSFFSFLQQATDSGLRDQMQIVSAQSPAEEIGNRLVDDSVTDGLLDFALTPGPALQAAAAGDISSGPADRLNTFRDRFNERFSERTFNSLAMSGYEAMMLLRRAIEKTGSIDNASLTEGFSSLTWSDVQDDTMFYYVPPNGSVSDTERQGNIFGGGNQAFYENSLQRWNQGKKEYQELIRVGPYWNQ